MTASTQSTPTTNAAASSDAARDWPKVSLVMPVRNERGFIGKCVEQVLRQDYPPDRLEVIVADGMSDDGTRDILNQMAEREARLRVIDNPGRIVSTGLNAAIVAAAGEIILRLDGHAEIAPDFVRQNVLLLEEHPEAWSVGGPIHHVGRTAFGKAVAVAMSHKLGVGNARHRYPNYEGYVEGAQFPAIRRWVFDRVGNFDEMQVRNQDDEFNFRMTQAGAKIFISPRVKYAYFVRDSIPKLARQYFQYSFWRLPMLRKHRRPTTLRQLAPTFLFATMFLLGVVGIVLGKWWIAAVLPAIYLGSLLLAGLLLVPRLGPSVALRVPMAILVMHASYAWGWFVGLAAAVFRPQAWNPEGTMAKLSR